MDSRKVIQSELNELFREQISVDVLDDAVSLVASPHHADAPEYLAFSLSVPAVDLLAMLEQDDKREQFQYYWEKPIDQFAIIASGELERITASGEDRYRVCSRRGKDLLRRVHHVKGVQHRNASVHLFGGFSFFEDKTDTIWNSYENASFTLPEWMVIREGNSCILTFILPVKSTDRSNLLEYRINKLLSKLDPLFHSGTFEIPSDKMKGSTYTHMDAENGSEEHQQWMSMVDDATDAIKNGAFRKVVLARQLRIPTNGTVRDTCILNQLRHQYPDCYSFLVRQDGESSFIGSTPERLASFTSSFVLTEGLAGSISRGKTASEDAVLEHHLMNSSKDRHEHDIVLEAIDENLTPYSVSVSHPEAPMVKKLSNVQHLYTPVTARIRDGVSRTEVLRQLHPTPAVGGFPRQPAVEFIKQREPFNRGWYASPVGWINANGDGEFIVAIRSGLIRKNEVRFFAGCGIVEDSDPQKEWDETNLKFIPMLSALEYAGS